MESSSSTSNSKAEIPWAGLVALALILIFEHGLYRPEWSVQAGRHHADRLVASKLLLVDEAPAADYLLLGDSAVSIDLDAGLLTEHFKPSTFLNLGLVGSTSVVGTCFILDRYLEHHPPPRAAFLMFSPLALNYQGGEIVYLGRLTRYFKRSSEIRAYSPLGADAVARGLLHKLIPSSEWNEFFWNFPRHDLKSWADFQRWWRQNAAFYPAVRATRGFTPVTENGHFDQRDFTLHLTRLNQLALEALIARLQSQGVEIYFAFPPIPEGSYRVSRQNSATVASQEALLRELESRGVKRFPVPESGPDEWFGSVYHLREDATPEFNRRLARELEKLL